MKRSPHPWTAAALFATVMLAHGLSRNITPFDSRWVVYSAFSLLHHGDLDLDEFKPRLEQDGYYATECVGAGKEWAFLPGMPPDAQRNCNGRYYHFYPLAVPVITAPVLWAVEGGLALGRPVFEWFERRDPEFNPFRHNLATGNLIGLAVSVELGAACVFVALATVFVYFMCLEDLTRTRSIALALVFAFATSAWSTASRALWQHTLSLPCLAAALWLLSAARRKPALAAWAGLPLMAAFWVRPTNIVSLGLFGLYVLVFYRRQALPLAAAMLPVALLFGAITFSIYDSPLAPYANAGRAAGQLKLHPEFWLAIAGNLWSPARGLFIYMPFVLLIPFFAPDAALGTTRLWLHRTAMAVVPLHTVLISSYLDWWGGHCFGPRYFTDLCPLFIFLAIPVAGRIDARRQLLAAAALILVAFGVFVHWRGAHARAVLDWNTSPVEIRQAQWRIWDWSDLPFLRGSGR